MEVLSAALIGNLLHRALVGLIREGNRKDHGPILGDVLCSENWIGSNIVNAIRQHDQDFDRSRSRGRTELQCTGTFINSTANIGSAGTEAIGIGRERI